MSFNKTIAIADAFQCVDLSVYLRTTHKDEFWNPEHSVLLKNIKVNVSAN